MIKHITFLTLLFYSLSACSQSDISMKKDSLQLPTENLPKNPAGELDTITLGAGCFWCVEAVFQRLQGVVSVESGYSNGQKENPTYQEVCTGTTGHVEVAQIVYKPAEISLAALLEVFWASHNPTQLNRQGNDVGTQYRSGIYYRNEYQKNLAEQTKSLADASGIWSKPIVTEVVALENYNTAEGYHQNYFNDNTRQPYCTAVIAPKVEKVKKLFKDKLKEEYIND